MPLIGLGTWQAKKGEVGAAVRTALEVGYRHIDCAACYGNEEEVGDTFTAVFAEGKLSRKDVFVTSKLWNSEHRPEHVQLACETCVIAGYAHCN
jgi:alcohol dehydrogenase (NADP+)